KSEILSTAATHPAPVTFGHTDWSPVVRLLPCQSDGDLAYLNAPWNRLPPSFGTKFIVTPPTSVSAVPPAVRNTISCAIASLWYACTAPSPMRPLVGRPSTVTFAPAAPTPWTTK